MAKVTKYPKHINGLYAKHVWAYNQKRCVYCGCLWQADDHVPARKWVHSLGTQYFSNVNLLTVPTCHECNSILGAIAIHTIAERKSYINEKLLVRYKSLLKSPAWLKADKDELGYNLNKFVNTAQFERERLEERLKYSSELHPWDLC
jgi:hypothetical protein